MSLPRVAAVWLWRYTLAPFKATYGRLPGTSYTKDFLQASGECSESLNKAFGRSGKQRIDVQLLWPGGFRTGEIYEAADYEKTHRLNLRWKTNQAPDPWRLYSWSDPNPLKTFVGDPNLRNSEAANREYEALRDLELDPWLVVVKLDDGSRDLHVRAYLGTPPRELQAASAAALPEMVRQAMNRVPIKGGCAAAVMGVAGESQIWFNPDLVHNAWSDSPVAAAPRRDRRPPPGGGKELAVSYRPAATNFSRKRKVFEVDPVIIERGLTGHNSTQEKLRRMILDSRMTPLSPGDNACDFDIAWETPDCFFVAEVKSIRDQNERMQLRLGLGQVLQYTVMLRRAKERVQPVLAVERKPKDSSWVEICESVGVRLVWPETFASLFPTR